MYQHILLELLKMDYSNVAASYLLKRCLIRQQPNYLRVTKGISILLFFLSASIIAIELLVIRPFYNDWNSGVEILRSSIFVAGILLLLGAFDRTEFAALRKLIGPRESSGSVEPR